MSETITTTEKNTVIARLRAIPDNAVISIGFGLKPLTKDEMIDEVENGTEIGKEIVEMQMTYLRSLKNR
jgi:hypothetical protein